MSTFSLAVQITLPNLAHSSICGMGRLVIPVFRAALPTTTTFSDLANDPLCVVLSSRANLPALSSR